jgi:hypothetical protein
MDQALNRHHAGGKQPRLATSHVQQMERPRRDARSWRKGRTRPLEASSGGLPTLWMELYPIPLWPPGRTTPFSRIWCEAADRVGSQQHVLAHPGKDHGLERLCEGVRCSNFAGGRLKLRIFCICKKSWMPRVARVVGNLSHEMSPAPPPPSDSGSQKRRVRGEAPPEGWRGWDGTRQGPTCFLLVGQMLPNPTVL